MRDKRRRGASGERGGRGCATKQRNIRRKVGGMCTRGGVADDGVGDAFELAEAESVGWEGGPEAAHPRRR
jgi:hypothetical protein